MYAYIYAEDLYRRLCVSYRKMYHFYCSMYALAMYVRTTYDILREVD